MNKEMLFLIIGMGLVTFLPRMIPLVLLQEVRLPKFWQGVLKNVPFAILGALIFPAVFFIHEEHVYFGIIGALIAFILAFLGANVIVVVVGSVIILSLVTLIIKTFPSQLLIIFLDMNDYLILFV